ncbi:MAG: hypothetical protein PHD00_02285 [Bacteroidales bacterium]|nr:hypothetical protein [Bacteroidales bacterium]MDD4671480.1 hypothetical protein [Bacteroidales bacterium]MDY0348526.1 hypothetical protein [Tenuifilaceae bacterium]
MRKIIFPILIIIIAWLTSCYKETISSDPSIKLGFSSDTVMFDTVFTNVGSATRFLKIYNKSSKNVEIESIELAGGQTSPYRINIDGEPNPSAKNVFLKGNDSLFVFVEVTVNPTNSNSPLLITDSIIFNTNGNFQNVKLAAWGQDVHLLNNKIITTDTIFTADKPYLIINDMFVAPNINLTINAGAALHFHNQAMLKVLGTLTVNGEPDNPVTFSGDRLEEFYKDKAGQWGGIWLAAGSYNSFINWAEIKNAIYGVIADTIGKANTKTLTLHNSRIQNMSANALLARGAIVEAGNCLFANTADQTVSLIWGGDYNFYHCTIANYWGQYISRKSPALLLWNYYIDHNNNVQPRDIVNAYFGNCIIYGSRNDEVSIIDEYDGQPVNAQLNYTFENCIVRIEQALDLTDETHFKNTITENPKFKLPFEGNFELDTLSAAKDIGLKSISTLFPFDLNNVSRTSDNGPDLGSFERIETD